MKNNSVKVFALGAVSACLVMGAIPQWVHLVTLP